MTRRILAVSGAHGSGKTTRVRELAQAYRARGHHVGGIAQPVVWEDGQRQGYDLVDLATGERRPFAQRRAPASTGELGFVFEPEGWTWAMERILQARRTCDVLVVDELGRLEAQGEGHLPALVRQVSEERAHTWILAVRAGFEAEILSPLEGGVDGEAVRREPGGG